MAFFFLVAYEFFLKRPRGFALWSFRQAREPLDRRRRFSATVVSTSSTTGGFCGSSGAGHGVVHVVQANEVRPSVSGPRNARCGGAALEDFFALVVISTSSTTGGFCGSSGAGHGVVHVVQANEVRPSVSGPRNAR